MNEESKSEFKINLNELDNAGIGRQEYSINIENQKCNKEIVNKAINSLFKLTEIETTHFMENISKKEEKPKQENKEIKKNE